MEFTVAEPGRDIRMIQAPNPLPRFRMMFIFDSSGISNKILDPLMRSLSFFNYFQNNILKFVNFSIMDKVMFSAFRYIFGTWKIIMKNVNGLRHQNAPQHFQIVLSCCNDYEIWAIQVFFNLGVPFVLKSSRYFA